mmetsp:Transcript_11305/g.30550  ORF Transcript_11305/g.30550 Transcript_11305/m.30550 type:complete len:299 (-) Transcript_11305:1569-2465(-)
MRCGRVPRGHSRHRWCMTQACLVASRRSPRPLARAATWTPRTTWTGSCRASPPRAARRGWGTSSSCPTRSLRVRSGTLRCWRLSLRRLSGRSLPRERSPPPMSMSGKPWAGRLPCATTWTTRMRTSSSPPKSSTSTAWPPPWPSTRAPRAPRPPRRARVRTQRMRTLVTETRCTGALASTWSRRASCTSSMGAWPPSRGSRTPSKPHSSSSRPDGTQTSTTRMIRTMIRLGMRPHRSIRASATSSPRPPRTGTAVSTRTVGVTRVAHSTPSLGTRAAWMELPRSRRTLASSRQTRVRS